MRLVAFAVLVAFVPVLSACGQKASNQWRPSRQNRPSRFFVNRNQTQVGGNWRNRWIPE